MSAPLLLELPSDRYVFTWDLVADRAQLVRRNLPDLIWSGSLLPLFWVADARGAFHAIKARVQPDRTSLNSREATLTLHLAEFGEGKLVLAWGETHLQFRKLEVTWSTPQPLALHALYFGCNVLTPLQRPSAPSLDQPFWPDWRAEGFAAASARTNPIQSFLRSWDFGHADIALGSFGPAMGTPYAAAYPRPTYAACAGGRHGWLCFGAGSVPDAALTFQVRARSASLEWRYREDLWGAPAANTRTWEDPLWLTWADTAWHAHQQYFRLFPLTPPKPASHQKSFWGTWGDFRVERFELRSSIDRARDDMAADLLCVDDPWEIRKGSCRPHPQSLPHLADDLAYAHQRGLGVGIWMPTGWIEDPAAEGLTAADLLLNRDGEPVRSNWAVDPHEASQQFYCLDPASLRARDFLRERTHRIVRDYRPTLLKVDFGYGIPGPDACTSRDPAFRGERLAWTYAKLIADAAHELDPAITLLGYSIHPLWTHVQDQISLDDLGDAGEHEAAGHGQWSIWAALAGERGTALMGSSGYLWSADADVLQNSAILGAPGANLPHVLADGTPLPAVPLARRRGLFRWFRRTTQWQPLWLDSALGDLRVEPTPNSWGRVETIDGRPAITALALREPSSAALAHPALRGLRWSGRWIVLAQGNASIFDAPELALIPLAPGHIEIPRTHPTRDVRMVFGSREDKARTWHVRDHALQVVVDAATHAEPLLGLLVLS